MILRYVLGSLTVLNGLLLAAIAALVYFAVIPVLNPAARLALPPAKEAKAPLATSPGGGEPYRTLEARDYDLIGDQTLFHPERKIPPEKAAEKAVPKPDLLLNGTLISGEGSFAFVEDRKAAPSAGGRDKRQITLRKGASFGGYLLSEIGADRIVLVKGEDRVVVMLNDREKRRDSPAPSRGASGGGSLSPQPASAPPTRTLSPSPQTAPSPGAGTGVAAPRSGPSPVSPPQQPQPAPPSALPPVPGIGGSGVYPPTRSSVEQTRQKLQEAQQIRTEQLKKSLEPAP